MNVNSLKKPRAEAVGERPAMGVARLGQPTDRTAVVDLQDSVFIGRMFFGDQEDEDVLWEDGSSRRF